jgi:hypothetical protein
MSDGETSSTSATQSASKRVRLGRNRLAQRLPSSYDDETWQPPTLSGGFAQRIGSSVVEEFVAGHDASDVVRELTQNEFDAAGSHVSVAFGDSGLTVAGNGRAIDSRGWSRLDVILGTGRVLGGESDDSIEPKENGIGSKNFGLRSLFLFGNRIYVRSNGQMAVLDLPAMGTKHLKDVTSRGRRGVSVHVPYRLEQFQSLAPFTIEHERSALERIEVGLLPTLVKLALSGPRAGIRRLTVVSKRTGRELAWRQDAEKLKSKVNGVSALRRIGRLRSLNLEGSERTKLQVFEENEFSRAIEIPSEHSTVRFPSYYSAPGGKVRVSVSIPLRRGGVSTAASPVNSTIPFRHLRLSPELPSASARRSNWTRIARA